jgi:positive regulator of sigma E activity
VVRWLATPVVLPRLLVLLLVAAIVVDLVGEGAWSSIAFGLLIYVVAFVTVRVGQRRRRQGA